MGTRFWHIERAKHHRSAAEYLVRDSAYIDWAVVALFYAANHWVHSCLSGDPVLSKDERHPRKHSAPVGPGNGGRGTNQLVRDRMRPIYREYIDLFEASRRTRYDVAVLGDENYERWVAMLDRIQHWVGQVNSTRRDRPTEEP